MWKRLKRWWRIRKLQRQLDYAEYVAYDWALGNVVRDHYRAEAARLASELAIAKLGL